MPYGGGTQALRNAAACVGIRDGRPSAIALADVATYLEAMVQVLEEHSAEESARSLKLKQNAIDIEALRRIFGSALAAALGPDAERHAVKRARAVRKRPRG